MATILMIYLIINSPNFSRLAWRRHTKFQIGMAAAIPAIPLPAPLLRSTSSPWCFCVTCLQRPPNVSESGRDKLLSFLLPPPAGRKVSLAYLRSVVHLKRRVQGDMPLPRQLWVESSAAKLFRWLYRTNSFAGMRII